MGFLNTRCVVLFDEQWAIRERQRGTTVSAKEGNRFDPHSARCLERLEDVGRFRAGGEGDEDVAGLAQGAHLPRKDMLEAVVVGDAGQDGRMRSECDGGQWMAILFIATDEFGGQMCASAALPPFPQTSNLQPR
jgi:hypothetical protein